MRPCKSWDIYHIKWLAGFLQSTVCFIHSYSCWVYPRYTFSEWKVKAGSETKAFRPHTEKSQLSSEATFGNLSGRSTINQHHAVFQNVICPTKHSHARTYSSAFPVQKYVPKNHLVLSFLGISLITYKGFRVHVSSRGCISISVIFRVFLFNPFEKKRKSCNHRNWIMQSRGFQPPPSHQPQQGNHKLSFKYQEANHGMLGKTWFPRPVQVGS